DHRRLWSAFFAPSPEGAALMATALSAGLPPAWMLARTLSRQLSRRGGPVLLMRLVALPKHGGVIVCATTTCLRARLRTAPIRSRERQRADAQLLMTFGLAHAPQRHPAPLGAGHAKKCGWKPAPDYRHAATRVTGMRVPGGGITARR